MGQRSGPRPIPSLLEYKTIRLRDADRLDSGKATSEQGQKGGLDLDANKSSRKPASASCPQLPPSLASYGGMHSFSQMAQFLPSICDKNIKRRPPSLLPLSVPGLSSGQSSDGSESTIKPFYRSSMPEAFLSASSNLINSASTVPYTDTRNFFYNQFGAKTTKGLECIGKSSLEPKRQKTKSEPACHVKSDKLPPIARSHCTVHSTKCSCVRTENDKKSSPDKKSVRKDGKDVKRGLNTVAAGRRIVKGVEPNGIEPKVTRMIRKTDKKSGLKTKQPQKRQPPEEANMSIGSEPKHQMSPHGRQQAATNDDEEEGVSSYVCRNRIHTHTSPRSNTSNNENETHYDHNEREEENELDFLHRNSSILHPPPGSLPPITNPKAHNRKTSLLEDLGEQSEDLDNMGWAKDGFLEDSTLRRAILLRKRALYNNSSNNTTAESSDNAIAVFNSVPCEKVQQETKDEVIDVVKEISKPLEVTAEKSVEEVQEKNVTRFKDTGERKLGWTQHIPSVTWQDVSPHLGPQKTKASRVQRNQTLRSGKLTPIVGQKSKSSIANDALRQKNRVRKHRDHTNCVSTIPEALTEDQSSTKTRVKNLLPIQSFGPQDLAICCGARTSKSFGTLPGKEATDMPNLLPDAATLFTSSYPKFVKMFSLPVYETRFPPSEQTGKEKKFEGHIDGKKVKQIGHVETDPHECQREESAEPPSKPK